MRNSQLRAFQPDPGDEPDEPPTRKWRQRLEFVLASLVILELVTLPCEIILLLWYFFG